MSETQTFPTADVLGAITGYLLGEMGGIYKVLEFMSSGPVWTHQIPRISREAVPVVLAMHPHLAPVLDECKGVNPDTVQAWLSTWIDRYGAEIAVPCLSADQHERIDPLSELAEKVDPDRIAVISTGGDQ